MGTEDASMAIISHVLIASALVFAVWALPLADDIVPKTVFVSIDEAAVDQAPATRELLGGRRTPTPPPTNEDAETVVAEDEQQTVDDTNFQPTPTPTGNSSRSWSHRVVDTIIACDTLLERCLWIKYSANYPQFREMYCYMDGETKYGGAARCCVAIIKAGLRPGEKCAGI